MPPVSTISKYRSPAVTKVDTRSRVTPAVGSTMLMRRPASQLKSADLPTFGRPTMATRETDTVPFLTFGAALGCEYPGGPCSAATPRYSYTTVFDGPAATLDWPRPSTEVDRRSQESSRKVGHEKHEN